MISGRPFFALLEMGLSAIRRACTYTCELEYRNAVLQLRRKRSLSMAAMSSTCLAFAILMAAGAFPQPENSTRDEKLSCP